MAWRVAWRDVAWLHAFAARYLPTSFFADNGGDRGERVEVARYRPGSL